jgi:L-ascorbate metabolism protein UlaG (beta-lactamase superfamily)
MPLRPFPSSAGLVMALLAGEGCCILSGPVHHGPRTACFDGARFHNLEGVALRAELARFAKWVATRRKGEWREWTDAPPGPRPPARVGGERLRVTFVNHSTVLVQTGGLNILTDPIWSERASPISWAGPRRVRPPGIRFEELPRIDLVLVSHNHYDHLDLPTLVRLAAAHHPRFVVGLGNAELLRRAGIRDVWEVDWWQELDLGAGGRLVAVPAQHFSSRGLCDRDATLWTGFVVESPAGRVYFAGDTGFGPHFRMIRERLGPVRVALLPIGAFRPEWFMGPMHMSPRDAVRAHELLGAGASVGIHFGTFRLADDGQDEPVRELRRAVEAAAREGRLVELGVLGFGEGREL